MKAMINIDFDTFMGTVCSDKITLIMPNGSLITEYDKFSKLHEEWFKDTDWSIEYKIINTIESDAMSTALLAIEYKDVDEKGNPILMTYYLNLIFKKINEKWLLIHDQNTTYKQ